MTPVRPTIGEGVYIANTAYVGGDVTLGDGCTVLHHVTIRGDVSSIRIGARCNIQDGTVIHTKTGVDLDIEDDVAIGHKAVVHCTRVGSGTLVGMGAIILDECVVGKNCVIGAGAVIPPGTEIPDGKLVVGVPGKILRDTGPREKEYIDFVLGNYQRLNREHAAGKFPNWNET